MVRGRILILQSLQLFDIRRDFQPDWGPPVQWWEGTVKTDDSVNEEADQDNSMLQVETEVVPQIPIGFVVPADLHLLRLSHTGWRDEPLQVWLPLGQWPLLL